MRRPRSSVVLFAAAFCVLAQVSVGAPREREPNDPLYPSQWELVRMRVPEAWSKATGRGVTIALIGIGGVDLRHEDLVGKLSPGFDFFDGDSTPEPGDHDTMAAGIAAAATNNGKGVVGVALDARLMPITLGSDLGKAIRWAVDHGARVVYFEFGYRGGFSDMTGTGLFGPTIGAGSDQDQAAINYAWRRGAVLLGGAGNDALPACYLPAAYDHVLCVGAAEQTEPAGTVLGSRFSDTKSYYSNFGVDVVAPGAGQGPTWEDLAPNRHDRYSTLTGTSAAVAHAAGITALLLSTGARNGDVIRAMKCTAKDLGPQGVDSVYGYGLLDAARAVAALRSHQPCDA